MKCLILTSLKVLTKNKNMENYLIECILQYEKTCKTIIELMCPLGKIGENMSSVWLMYSTNLNLNVKV